MAADISTNANTRAHNVAIVTGDEALRGMLTVWLEDAGYSVVHPQASLDADADSVIYVTDTTPDSTSAAHVSLRPPCYAWHGTCAFSTAPGVRADFIASLASLGGASAAIIRLDSYRKAFTSAAHRFRLRARNTLLCHFFFRGAASLFHARK